MLQKMRAFSKSIFASILMGALALSFVVWGIADVFRSRTDTDVATIGSTTISSEAFRRDYQNFLKNRGAEEKREITPDIARREGLGDVALEQALNRTAIDNVTNDFGLTVSDGDVSERIRSMRAFFGPLGTFDKQAFDAALSRNNYTEQSFLDAQKSDMTRDQLLGPFEDGLQAPAGYVHALFAYSTELRSTEYVVVSAGSLGPIAPPSEAALTAYVKSQPARFSTPEYRDVTVAVAGPEDVAASIKVTDAQIQTLYDARKAQYVIPEKRDVEQITFPDEASAKAARAKVDGGMAFQAVAFAVRKTVDPRGSVSQDDLGPNGAAVFALPIDGVTQPLKNFSSWVLMHVTKSTPGKTTTLDQAKPELVKELTNQQAQNKLIDAQNAYTDAISSGAEMLQAAKKSGMRLIHIPAVDAKGLAPNGSKASLPADRELLAQISSAEVGEPGDPFPTKAGYIDVVSVNGVTPPKVKSLDSVRAEATAAWTAEQTKAKLKQRASELADEARKTGDLKSVAQKIGSPLLTGAPTTRDKTDAIFSGALVTNLFATAPGGIAFGPTSNGTSYIVARVSGVLHPPLPEASPSYQQGVRLVGGQIAQDITISFAKAQRDKQGTSVNRPLVDKVLGGDQGS